MRPYVGFTGTSAEMRANSAVDVALWDIQGKATGQPLYALFGGATRDRIRVYNTCAGPDYVSKSSDVRPGNFGLDSEVTQRGKVFNDLRSFMTRADELAAELLEMGIQSMKIWPFDFAEGAVDGGDISTEDLRRAMLPFQKVREAHGDRMRLKAELHGIWGLTAAKKICAALEEIAPDWVEDPIWMDRISDVAELAASTRAPLAGGETLGGLGQLRELIQVGRIGTPIIDVTWGGGLTFAKKRHRRRGLCQAGGVPRLLGPGDACGLYPSRNGLPERRRAGDHSGLLLRLVSRMRGSVAPAGEWFHPPSGGGTVSASPWLLTS